MNNLFPQERTNSLPSKIPARTRKKVCFCYPRPVSPIRRLTENCQPCRSHKVYFRHYSVAVSVSLKTIHRPHLGSAIWDAEWRRHHLNRFYVHLRLLETIKCIQIPFRIRWGGPLLVCDQYCYKIPSVSNDLASGKGVFLNFAHCEPIKGTLITC